MKVKFLKARHWLLVALLGLLGFTACNKEDEDDQIHLMYGVPESTYNPGN
jgi:hypothetical protein